jgi:type II secretory pathway pseudopilin PulG
MLRKREGFTFAEVLFALFLVAITALVMAAALPLGHHSRQKADLHLKAAEICQRQLERLREVGYPNLTAEQLLEMNLISSTGAQTEGYPFTEVDQSRGDAVSTVLPSGQGWVKIYDVGLDLRSLVVTVRWVEDSRTREIQMGTLVGNL